MQKCYLLCGAPGSGKTWVSEQIKERFNFLVHDEHPIEVYPRALLQACQVSELPVLGNLPFRVSVVVDFLRKNKVEVHCIYVIEPYDVIAQRFMQREGREKFSPWHRSQIRHMERRAHQMAEFKGTSLEVLEYMRNLAL